MKKLILTLLLFVSIVSAFAQAGNDTTKYINYKYAYGNRLARYWADTVLMTPRDTVYSKYGLALIGSTFYHGDGTRWYAGVNAGGVTTNIYNSDGTLSAGTRTLTFNNNLLQFYSASGASAEFDINLNNGSTGTYFARGPGTATQYTGTATTQNGFNERGTYAEIFGINTSSGHSNRIRTYGDSSSFNSDNGFYRFQNLPTSSDTSAIKPGGYDATGKLVRFTYWPGSGGSNRDTVHFTMKGNIGDSLIWVKNPDSLFTRLYRDSLNFHHINNADGSVTFYSDAVTTWSGVIGGSSATASDLTIPNSGAGVQYVFNGTSAKTFTLPALGSNGNRVFFFKNAGTANLTIKRGGTDTLFVSVKDTAFVLTPGQTALTISSPFYWYSYLMGGGSHNIFFQNLTYNINDSTAGLGVNAATQDLHLNFQNAYKAYLDSLAAGLYFTGLTTQSIDTTSYKALVWNPSTKRVQPMYWPSTGGSGGGAIGSAITGGTAGSVLYLGTGGILQQTNSKFYYDSTNKRLGVNISSPSYTIQAEGQLAATNGASYMYLDPSLPSGLGMKVFQSGVGDWRRYYTGNGTGGNLAEEFRNTNSSTFSSIIAKETITGTNVIDQATYGGPTQFDFFKYTGGANFFMYWAENGARYPGGFGFPTGTDLWTFRMNDATTISTGSEVLRLHADQNVQVNGQLNVGATASATSVLQTTSFSTAITTSAVDIALTSAHNTIVLSATGKTATLPTAVGIQGREYTIKLTASGSGTVATTSSQTIDGSTTYSLASQYKYVTVQSDGSNWIVKANN